MSLSVLVVGAGAIGLQTARLLALAGCQVRVLDRQRAARESSWAGGGILSPLYPWRYVDPISALAREGHACYADLTASLAQSSGVDAQWTRSGLLCCGVDDASDATAWAQRFGYHAELLDDDQVREVAGPVSPGRLPADSGRAHVWLPEIAQVRTPRLGKALRLSMSALGVELLEDQPVERIVVEAARAVGVEVAGQVLRADRIVVTAGAWTAALLSGLADAVADTPIAPVKGQMVLFDAEPSAPMPVVLEDGRYLIQRRDGRTLIGSTLESAGFDKSITDDARDDLVAAALSMMPSLAEAPVETQWAGLRPGKLDDLPIIGEHPEIDSLFVNAGHYRNGVILAPGAARLLSELLLEREPFVDPSAFAFSGYAQAR